MGDTIQLTSAVDGFIFDAYRAPPGNARQGGLVLIQEIFGVTGHIRALADGYAEVGYDVIAPSFYDRLEPGFEADYGPEAVAKGARFSQATSRRPSTSWRARCSWPATAGAERPPGWPPAAVTAWRRCPATMVAASPS